MEGITNMAAVHILVLSLLSAMENAPIQLNTMVSTDAEHFSLQKTLRTVYYDHLLPNPYEI